MCCTSLPERPADSTNADMLFYINCLERTLFSQVQVVLPAASCSNSFYSEGVGVLSVSEVHNLSRQPSVTLCCRLQLCSSDFLICSSSCLQRSFWLASFSDSSSPRCLALLRCFRVAGDSTSTVWVTYWANQSIPGQQRGSVWCILQQGFQTGLVPSPLVLCPSRGPTRAAALSPCPPVSSAPPLSSTRSVRSVSPGGTAVRSAAVRTAPAGGFCCAGFRSPAPTNHKRLRLPCPASDVPPILLPCVSPSRAWCWTARGWWTAAAGGPGWRSGSVSGSRSLLTDTELASLSPLPPEGTKHDI